MMPSSNGLYIYNTTRGEKIRSKELLLNSLNIYILYFFVKHGYNLPVSWQRYYITVHHALLLVSINLLGRLGVGDV